jgi:hypothetical protein
LIPLIRSSSKAASASCSAAFAFPATNHGWQKDRLFDSASVSEIILPSIILPNLWHGDTQAVGKMMGGKMMGGKMIGF